MTPLLLAATLLVAQHQPADVEQHRGSVRTSASARSHGLYLSIPALAAIVATGPSSGGDGSITSGTTTITGGADTRVCFNDAGVMNCNDAGFTYNKTTDSVNLLGNITAVTGIFGTSVELSHASANTLTASGGVLSIEGVAMPRLTTANVFTARNTFGSAADAANSIDVNETANCITFEGATADAHELRLCVADPGASGGDITLTTPAFGTAGAKTLVAAEAGAIIVANWSFNNDQTLAFGTSSNSKIQYNTTQTPDTLLVRVGALSNVLWVMEDADQGSDANNGPCGTAACTQPHIGIHSATAGNTTDYRTMSAGGFAGKSVKTLVEGNATATVQVLLTAAEQGSSGTYHYTVYATDGATPQVRSGRVVFSIVNDGGTDVCVLGTPEELDNTPTGDLTATITCADSGTNAASISVNATSSLTQTTLEAYSSVDLTGPGQIVPQ